MKHYRPFAGVASARMNIGGMGIMVDLSLYRGIAQFGRAYQMMLQEDSHALGSVVRVLMDRMIRLCSDTATRLYTDFTPLESLYLKGTRPELERCAEEGTTGCSSLEERIEGIVTFTRGLGRLVSNDLVDMVLGGTEEEITARGSDWCTDVARVGCILFQVLGLPARLVNLFDTSQAYSGHVIVEVHRNGAWGAVDTSTAVVYRLPDGWPASTWRLMNQPALVDAHRRGRETLYTTPGQFRAAALSNYFVWESDKYIYKTSGLNDYYRSILEMSDRGWPGGLRWLHGEDGAEGRGGVGSGRDGG